MRESPVHRSFALAERSYTNRYTGRSALQARTIHGQLPNRACKAPLRRLSSRFDNIERARCPTCCRPTAP